MTVAQKRVAFFLTEQGKEVLRKADCVVAEAGGLVLYVQDVDDYGLWVRVERPDADHIVLVRWEYVLTLDFLAEATKPVGLRR